MNDPRHPTFEEIRATLEAAGINMGAWNEQDAKIVGSDAVKGQVDLLLRLKGALEMALKDDVKRVAVLREQRVRLERGGGGS